MGLGLRRHVPPADDGPDADVRVSRSARSSSTSTCTSPGASPTSISAANTSRNFQIAPAFAWSRLLQVQGFGQRYEDASGNTVGTIAISANQISRYITFRVSKASLGGTPGSGWAFTVVLHGQDGFSSDKARGFAPTPADFLFGVCAAASSDPHCTASPGSVPKATDVLTPPGVLQADELDYTLHNPVVLQGVTIPKHARHATQIRDRDCGGRCDRTDHRIVGYGRTGTERGRAHRWRSARPASARSRSTTPTATSSCRGRRRTRCSSSTSTGTSSRRSRTSTGPAPWWCTERRFTSSRKTSAPSRAIDLSTLTDSGPVATGLALPGWLAFAGGKLWTAVNGQYGWAAARLGRSRRDYDGLREHELLRPDFGTSSADPNTLYVAEDGLSPGAIFRLDVSSGAPVVVASNTFTDQSNIEQLAVSPDGTRVIPAAGAPLQLRGVEPVDAEG